MKGFTANLSGKLFFFYYDGACLKTDTEVYKQRWHEKNLMGLPDLSKIGVKLRESAQKRLSGGKAAAAWIIVSRCHKLVWVA